MGDLEVYQTILICFVFIWSGIVRSGLGFGGAVLALPFLLLIDDQPLVFLPIIAVHLLIFSSLTIYQNQRQAHKGVAEPTVAWSFLGKALLVMLIPKLIGVFGLITMPTKVMNTIIFSVISLYALSYVFNRPFKSKNKIADILFLMLGGYISGTSLIGAPVVVAVFSKYLSRYQLRDTLFALWFILVTIKMGSFIYADVDLQLIHHLWLLPCAAIGHFFGLKLHRYLLKTDSIKFYRVLGATLLLTSGMGLYKAWLT
ncbi:MAG: putative membrane protein YfcA [Cellvibrionaceae bacterium]